MLPAMNSVVGRKKKKVAKGDLASEITCTLNKIKQISKKHGPEAADHYPLFPAQYPRLIWIKFYPTFPATFEAYGEATFWRIKLKQISHHVLGKPRNSSNIHPWWTQMKNIMNIQHSDEEHSNILMFILGTQQHSDGQNVHPDFQVKACGAQDTWHNTIGHLTTAIWAQKLYK